MHSLHEDADVFIADVGSAVKLQSAEETCSFIIGTPGYIAPEVLSGEAYGKQCDIWSVGALMHALISAQLPFWDEDRQQRKLKVCNDELDLTENFYLSALSDEAKDVLSGMLTKNPAERLTTDQVLQHAWFQ